MITNAVQHTVGDVEVRLSLGPRRLRVEVRDRSDRRPDRREVLDDSESGRGLHIVEVLARTGATSRFPTGGKVVWFELDRSTGGLMTIWTCTSCGSPNGSIAERCFRCGAPRVGPPPVGPAPGGPGSDEPSLVPLARYDVLPPGGQPDYSQPGHDPAAGGGYVPPEFHQPVQDPAGYVPPGYPQPAGYAPPGYPQPGQDPAAGGYAQPGQDPAAGGYAQPGYEAAPGYADPQYGDRPRRWWVPVLIAWWCCSRSAR